MLWKNISHKKIGIWGMGKEGLAVQEALLKYAEKPTIIPITEENTQDINRCDIVVKSPGVSLYRPEIQAAKQKGIIFTSGTNLFLANKPATVKVIGVTGTKGKSTTASLLCHTLNCLGYPTELGGNIGTPLLSLLKTKSPLIVAELSSYQCADIQGHFELALLTNLYHEHLQWHGTHQQYYNDKINMLRQSQTQIVNGTQKEIQAFINNLTNPVLFNTSNGFYVTDGFFHHGETALFKTDSLNLKGEHNAQNACAVLSVLKQLGINPQSAQGAFSSFQALPHRLQVIGTYNGITFVDDSISTTPETAIAAVKAFDRGQFITLLLGGLDRGQTFEELVDFLIPLKNRFCLIALPDTGITAARLAAEKGISTFLANTLQEAVAYAKEHTPYSGTVLLSPAAPSYNQYKNFEERGNTFKAFAIEQ